MTAQFAVGEKVRKLSKTGKAGAQVWEVHTVVAVSSLDESTQRVFKGQEFLYTVKNAETKKASNLWNEEHRLTKA